MPENKDYANLTLEELLIEEKKIKRKETFSAAIIGFLVGIMIYGAANNGFNFVYILIPLFLIYVVYKNSQKIKLDLEQIRAEINARSAK